MLITTITDTNYQKYAPWFVFFITKSYPEYKVKIYLTEEIAFKEAFEFVRTDNVEYIENVFPSFSKTDQELKTLLFLVKEKTKENVYIAGDIDVLTCRETPTIEDYHLKICELTGMIYNSYARFGHKRMKTCSHFVTPEYWQLMDSIIYKYRILHLYKLLNLGDYDKGFIGNEHILYKMLEEAELPIISIPESICINIIHGLHLGIWRNKYALPKFIDLQPFYYLRWFEYFLEIEQMEEYQYLYKLLPLKEIERMKSNLSKYFKENAKIKGF